MERSYLNECHEQWKQMLSEFQEQASLKEGQILVIGCSTSEVAGERIGTSGTKEVAKMIFDELQSFSNQHGIHLAFQCCEHLNRALIIKEEIALQRGLEPVTVVPVRKAGGAMATYAFHHLQDTTVVEEIQAEAGIDIGDTFIGMHLKKVAIPLRLSLHSLGHAHVTFARTRPKLIGGPRAVYE
jgi:uncharacterized protein (TIGR01440 family)